jgi:hypothetical protein
VQSFLSSSEVPIAFDTNRAPSIQHLTLVIWAKWS